MWGKEAILIKLTIITDKYVSVVCRVLCLLNMYTFFKFLIFKFKFEVKEKFSWMVGWLVR